MAEVEKRHLEILWENTKLKDLLREVVEQLQGVEWISEEGGWYRCPSCGRLREGYSGPIGHARGCALAATLEKCKEATP